MPPILAVRDLKTIILVLIAFVAITGCSKKEEKSAATAPPTDTGPAATPVAATPAVPDIVIPVSTDIRQSFADADAALNAKAYDKAVQNLVAVQKQKQLTDQQAQEARRRMIGLQATLTAAIANGDPNAKAAAELLRRSAMVK